MSDFLKTKGAKSSFFVVGLIAIAAVMFVVVSNSNITASNSAAQLIFTETEHDFGKVPSGPQLMYNFKFVNKGSSKLKIEKITTSCGCTAAATNGKEEFGKGEEGDISVTFNTRGREGTQEKTLMVFSNDPQNPQQVLKIKCYIDSSMK